VDETRFYELIDEARESAVPTAPSADPAALSDVLDELGDDELIGFHLAYLRQLERLNDWRVWGAGWAAARGMSDDAFHYFRSWLIGKGSEAVAVALSAPDELVDLLGEEDDELDNELLEYVALDLLDDRGLEVDAGEIEPDGEPAGEEFDEDDVEAQYPQLDAWARSRG
jgi:hypothetical protein